MSALIRLAAFMGLIAVGCGAFGAHALDDQLSAKAMGWWATAGQYLLPHAVGVLAVARFPRLQVAGWLWGVGSLIFATTLYALALGAPSLMGAITPIGGLLMLAGWGWLLVAAGRARDTAP